MRQIAISALAALLLAACASQGENTGDVAATAKSEAAANAPQPVMPRIGSNAGVDAILAMPHRSPDNRARDAWRHPKETLAMFEVFPHHTVIEVTPGGGWYTEVLGPYLRANGQLIAQVFDPASNERARAYYTKSNAEFRAKLAADSEAYDRVKVIEVSSSAPVLGSPASVDRVLTFRNVHNWTGAGTDGAMFKAFFDVLKPNGILGVVEHRAAPGTDPVVSAKTGYITEAYVIELATAAGFELAQRSEINANPNDTRDYKNGVWTLPPNLRLPEGETADKYRAIGESDRMTLKFIKPAR